MADTPLDQRVQDAINNLTKVTTVMGATMDMLVAKEGEFLDVMERIQKKFENLATDAKDTATHAATTRKELSDLLNLMHNTKATGIFDQKTMREVQERLKAIHETAKKISETPGYAARDKNKATETLLAVEKMLKAIEKEAAASHDKMSKLLDPDMAKKFKKALEEVEMSVSAVHDKIDKMRSPVAALGKAFKDTFGTMGIGLLEPFMRRYERFDSMRERGQMVKREAQERTTKGMEIFQTKVAKGKNKLTDFMGALPFDEKGELPANFVKTLDAKSRRELKTYARRIAKAKPQELQQFAGELSGRGGPAGAVESRMTANAVKRAAASILEGGEVAGGAFGVGSIAKGGGSLLAGAGEAGAGGMGEMFGGPVGIGIAVAGLIRDGFDSMIESNKDIFAKIGTSGGLLTGGGNPIQALQNVRQNVTPGLNLYGQTREGNMRIAETINKFGVSVGELSDTGNDLNKNIIGKAGAPAGKGIATTVFGGARLLGLDDVAATEQIMKVLLQYHKSLQDTDVFFNSLITDTKAAGLTTTKYLQIIDELTSQFDHMARGVDDVTSSLRMLGQTGLLTGEQVEDAMKTMLVQKNSTEMNAFLLAQAGPELRQGALQSFQVTSSNQARTTMQSVREAFSSYGLSEQDLQKSMSDYGIRETDLGKSGAAGRNAANNLENMLGSVLGQRTGGSAEKRQQAGAGAAQLTATQQQLEALTDFVAHPGIQSALNLASSPEKGPAFNNLINTIAIPTMLAKAGVGGGTPGGAFKAMMGGGTTQDNLRIQEFLKLINKTPEDLQNIRAPIRFGAAAEAQAARTGVGMTPEAYKAISKYVPGLKPGAGPEEVKAALQNQDTLNATIEELSTNVHAFEEMNQPNSPWAKAQADRAKALGAGQEDKAKALGEAMTSSRDYLKQIYDVLLLKVYGALSFMAAKIGYKTPEQIAAETKESEFGLSGGTASGIQALSADDFSRAKAEVKKAEDIQQGLKDIQDRTEQSLAAAQASTLPENATPEQKLARDNLIKQKQAEYDRAKNDVQAEGYHLSQAQMAMKALKVGPTTETVGRDVVGAFNDLAGNINSKYYNDVYKQVLSGQLPGVLAPGAAAMSPTAPAKPPETAAKTAAPVASHKTVNISGTAISAPAPASDVTITTEAKPVTNFDFSKSAPANNDLFLKIAATRNQG